MFAYNYPQQGKALVKDTKVYREEMPSAFFHGLHKVDCSHLTEDHYASMTAVRQVWQVDMP